MLSYLKISLFVISALAANGQAIQDTTVGKEIGVRLLAFTTGDSIIVRWAPMDLYAWHYANEHGYTLERQTVKENNKIFTEQERENTSVNLGVFKPLDSLSWQNNLNENDKWETLAAGSLYGDFNTFEPGVAPGSLTDIENQAIATNNRFTFHFIASTHSMPAAKKLGEVFVDYNVRPGDSYLYKISFNESGDNFFALKGDSYLVSENSLEKLPFVDSLEITCEDSIATLKWNTFRTHHQYMSYDVFKSNERDGTYTLINTAPVVSGKVDDFQTSYTDSLANNIDSVFYKVQGRTPFGFVGPESDVIAGKGQEKNYISRSVIRISEEIEPGKVIIGWESDPENDQFIKGFNIHIANTYGEQTYLANEELIPPTQRQYLIENAPRSSYIQVETVTLKDERFLSIARLVSLNDQEAPAKPEGLSCLLDTINNVVELEWKWGEEVDIDGYHVMASWSDNNDFHNISDSLIRVARYTFPVDARRNGEEFYFSLRATDFRMNDSEYSDACKVNFLDVVPPSKALIRTLHEGSSDISFEWASSPSPDVEKHLIYRKSQRNNIWLLIGEDSTNIDIALFKDSLGLQKNIVYLYKIDAVDRAGNITASETKKGKIWDDKLSEKIAHFNLKDASDKGKTKLKLSWKYFPPQLLDKMTIYRSTDTENWETYRILKQQDLLDISNNISTGLNEYEYVDNLVEQKVQYKYKVKAKLINGSSSPMSNTKSIQL